MLFLKILNQNNKGPWVEATEYHIGFDAKKVFEKAYDQGKECTVILILSFFKIYKIEFKFDRTSLLNQILAENHR